MALDIKEITIELFMTLIFVVVVVASNGQPIVVGGTLALVIFIGNLFGSGAMHVNPAITLGLLANGKIQAARAVSLVAVQLVGALGAVFLVSAIMSSARGSRVVNRINEKVGFR
jgi:glycerol uptake facilitator-like aquaporin